MLCTLVDAPCVTSLLSSVIIPVVVSSTDDAETTPAPFMINFGDGQIDILSYPPTAPAGFTVTPGDTSLTITPTQEM